MADYVLIKIPELTATTAIADIDLLVIETATGTRSTTYANLKSSIPNYGYLYGIFTSADLIANVFTVNHLKGTRLVKLTIWDPAGIEQRNLQPYLIDANNIAADFGGTIGGGDWEYLCEFWVGSGATSYPDPIYEPAQTQGNLILNTTTKNSAITVIDYNAYQEDNMVICSLRLSSTAVFSETGSGAVVGVLPQSPSDSWSFPGAIKKVSFYESAYGEISAAGEIKVFLGKANETYLFNFSYSLI
jgi:hypothetical protein